MTTPDFKAKVRALKAEAKRAAAEWEAQKVYDRIVGKLVARVVAVEGGDIEVTFTDFTVARFTVRAAEQDVGLEVVEPPPEPVLPGPRPGYEKADREIQDLLDRKRSRR